MTTPSGQDPPRDGRAPEPPHAEGLVLERPPLWSAIGVVVVLALAGFLFVANARIQGGVDARHPQDLPSLVQTELDRAEDLAEQVEELRSEVDRLTDASTSAHPLPDNGMVELAAGRVGLSGPGLTVTLTDAPAHTPQPDWVVNDDLVVHQQDLQAVINALWAGGADAMTLQGQRVVSTTAFRCVGNVLLLHGRHYSPPYVVQAIGDPQELQASLMASNAVQRYLDYVDIVGLGWSTTVEDEVEAPPFEGGLELRHASVPDGVPLFPETVTESPGAGASVGGAP
ncbi:DUF881 domain-containing protein [Cellulomonas bogoriensis]